MIFILPLIILMISLKDEIKRFEKMVYNKELAQFVTVDQMFVGGGITIESMINESNFIVQELKKMNAVFLNYCKLNEKVYNKIIEHELSLHNEHQKLNSMSNSIDRKIQDMTKTVSELKQTTTIENQKNQKLFEDVTIPLKQEVENKVDKSTFEAQMKKFLDEYDEGEAPNGGQEGKTEDRHIVGVEGGLGTGLTAQGLPIVKKKGKVGYEDFYKLQAETFTRMKSTDTKLDQASSDSTEAKQLIFKYIQVINKNTSELSNHSSQIYKLSSQSQERHNSNTATFLRLQNDLNAKTSDQVWSYKFEGFYEKTVKPIVSGIEEKIKLTQKEVSLNKQFTTSKIKNISDDLSKIWNQFSTTQQKIQTNTNQINYLQSNISSLHDDLQQSSKALQASIDQLKNDTQTRIKSIDKYFKTEVEQLHQTIDNLVQSIEQSVLKAVSKKIQLQLKTIQSEIKQNSDRIKGVRTDVATICDEIKNIKEILSHKANFSDIIHYVEKKADREDFKELQSKVHQTSQQFVSKNLNESLNLSKIIEKNEKVRAASVTRASKTLLPSRSPSNRINNKTDFDTSTKLFMCGFDSHIGDSRGLLSQNSRRKSLKSSSAVINDFML